ncbi:Nucleoside phosphorylase [Penicillium hordei]|uniref:Nucleoside phosphorylase n=1 Tax=Penicillium hordei TaxID=40994 RepID=A0AAD6DYY6_9EURO|nr:Nucleoside phosphorylase [Penicillium hordei]KAJ5597521.1 Nucleoside phosphorylase [Penicillium hordei]
MATKNHNDYTVGWICALPLEMAAAQVLLDEVHEDLPVQPNDHNAYTLGSIGKHNVVIACLPYGQYGIASATTVAVQLLSSFRSIRFGLMVGIGGGVPNEEADIRLGDVVVSKPTNTHGGVVQFDHGKALNGGQFQRTGMLSHPPQILLTALSKLQANHITGRGRFVDFIAEIERKVPKQSSPLARPTQEDRLYRADHNHVNPSSKTCYDCDETKTVPRPSRDSNQPMVHYGLIASSNQVVKDSQLRDRLGRELDAYCVEMEAAGLMNNYPCLVIRGICDYADSHKNKEWQGYAAAVAAAYAKELLSVTPVIRIDQTRTVRDTLSDHDVTTASPSKELSRPVTPSTFQTSPPVMINQSELGGIYLGTIRGTEIIPRLIQDPAFWRSEINALIRQLLLIHPQWWVERPQQAAKTLNDFFARNRLTFRVNILQRRTDRPGYSGHDRQYLDALFNHNLGWLNGFSVVEGVPEINLAILNLWSILEFLDRG